MLHTHYRSETVENAGANNRNCFCHYEGHRHWEQSFWQCEADFDTLGDGICDDGPPEVYNVTAKCLGDFGDCCLPVIDTSRCVECICLNDNTTHATSFRQYLNRFVYSEWSIEAFKNYLAEVLGQLKMNLNPSELQTRALRVKAFLVLFLKLLALLHFFLFFSLNI